MCHVLPREAAEDEAMVLSIAEFCIFLGRNQRSRAFNSHYIGGGVLDPRSFAVAKEIAQQARVGHRTLKTRTRQIWAGFRLRAWRPPFTWNISVAGLLALMARR
jgi:hypothetical protein